jgi:hypothetical protein
MCGDVILGIVYFFVKNFFLNALCTCQYVTVMITTSGLRTANSRSNPQMQTQVLDNGLSSTGVRQLAYSAHRAAHFRLVCMFFFELSHIEAERNENPYEYRLHVFPAAGIISTACVPKISVSHFYFIIF